MSIKDFLSTDPGDWVKFIPSQVKEVAVTFASATQTIVTVPANSVITAVTVIRATAWDVVTTFEIGKSGDTDWLMTTTQANVTGSIPSGEDAGVERKQLQKAVTSDTAVLLTLNQGAASAGAGYVIVEYQEFNR